MRFKLFKFVHHYISGSKAKILSVKCHVFTPGGEPIVAAYASIYSLHQHVVGYFTIYCISVISLRINQSVPI